MGARIAVGTKVGIRVGSAVGTRVGGTGVAVGGTGVAVGGTVGVGGTGVAVGVGVGGTGVGGTGSIAIGSAGFSRLMPPGTKISWFTVNTLSLLFRLLPSYSIMRRRSTSYFAAIAVILSPSLTVCSTPSTGGMVRICPRLKR